MPLSIPPTDFAAGRGYLNTTSIGIPPQVAIRALYSAVDDWALARAEAQDYDVWIERSRELWARMVGAPVGNVAVGPQVSYFTGIVAASLPPGAEVVGFVNDFPSLPYPFLSRGDLDVRLVPSVPEVVDAVRPSTDVVAVSAAQFTTGEVADLDLLADAAAASDALLVVDATQACGWLPLDAPKIDVLIAGTYKWLLSPRGTAFMAVRSSLIDRLRPTSPGWYASETPWESLVGDMQLAADARRFDLSPAWLSWVGTTEALQYLEGVGVEAIHEHDVALANAARTGLGLEPSDSAIVSLSVEDSVRERVAAAGVRTAIRGGLLRAAFHLYNDEEDVDLLLGAVRG